MKAYRVWWDHGAQLGVIRNGTIVWSPTKAEIEQARVEADTLVEQLQLGV